jgi:hypothetical protein
MKNLDNTEQDIMEFKKVFKGYVKNINLKKISIDWSTDLDYIY